ncbi:MAG: hypothetical protein GY910_21125, partial [bacterium]|nr:hypothetical protein [bacterium]
ENRRLREHFDRSVEYVSDEEKFIVRLRHFRGEVEVEEAGFFVREIDLDLGEVLLSDGTRESLELSSLANSSIDGALLCRVKRGLVAGGLLARFSHSAQADLLQAVEWDAEALAIVIGGKQLSFPDLDADQPDGDPGLD